MMKLHFNPASPFVRMVRIVAHEVGLDGQIELVPTGALTPIDVHPAVAATNPLGKLPALITDHGHPLHDSRVISEYLVHRSGHSDLLPDEPVKRFRILTLQSQSLGIADAGVAWRYEMVMRPETLRWVQYADRQKKRMMMALDDIEANWTTSLGDVDVGTIALASALGYLDFRFADWDWRTGRPALTAYYGRFAQRPSMTATQHANPT
jgi:glutathione S-transferase